MLRDLPPWLRHALSRYFSRAHSSLPHVIGLFLISVIGSQPTLDCSWVTLGSPYLASAVAGYDQPSV
jgi:hypothetical protein